LTFGLVVLVVMVVAVGASFIPAQWATAVDPSALFEPRPCTSRGRAQAVGKQFAT
jgi:hypothetical protein